MIRIGHIQGFFIGIILLITLYFGFKFMLQRLIIDNYSMRMMGLEKDEMFWADKLYLKLYWPSDRYSYTRMNNEAIKKAKK